MKPSSAFWQGFREGLNPMCTVAWLLFGAGHLAYLLCDRCGVRVMFGPYQSLMLASFAICERFRFSAPWECNE
jgi:hypothetical protein